MIAKCGEKDFYFFYFVYDLSFHVAVVRVDRLRIVGGRPAIAGGAVPFGACAGFTVGRRGVDRYRLAVVQVFLRMFHRDLRISEGAVAGRGVFVSASYACVVGVEAIAPVAPDLCDGQVFPNESHYWVLPEVGYSAVGFQDAFVVIRKASSRSPGPLYVLPSNDYVFVGQVVCGPFYGVHVIYFQARLLFFLHRDERSPATRRCNYGYHR